MKFVRILLAAGLLWAGVVSVWAQEDLIRQNLSQRMPELQKINSISETPMAGIFEVRFNDSDIVYSDARGDFLLRGNLLDTQKRLDLTAQRLDKFSAIDFAALPMQDAVTIVSGNGKRQLAVFADPNCGYCKKFEQDLQKIDNLTLHVFLYPVLGPDSLQKSQAIWCAKDQAKSWQDWMLKGVKPAVASCDTSVVQRNLALGRKYRVNGTPTIVFSNGTRVPGLISASEVEKYLSQIPS